MVIKYKEKKKAIFLRKKGKTYSQILSLVSVSKSTLSVWLRSVQLAKKQKQKITQAKIEASKKGGLARKEQRIKNQKDIYEKALKEIGNISKRELFLMGVCLYWAEGRKEKTWCPSARFSFSNMDPYMIQLIIVWLLKACKVEKSMIYFSIYLHENHKDRVDQVKKYWSKVTGFPVNHFSRLYWKRNKIKTKRKNISENYFGLMCVQVRNSSSFVRKINGWFKGIHKNIGGSSNGRTFGFGPKNRGSSPCPPAQIQS